MRRKIICLMVSRGGAVGSLEQYTFDLCAGLAQTHEVHLLADRPYAATCPKAVTFHALDLARSDLNPWLYWHIGQHIQRIRPDIVHAQAAGAAKLLRWLTWLFRKTVFVVTLPTAKAMTPACRYMDGICLLNTMEPVDFPAGQVCHLFYNATRLPEPLTPRARQGIRDMLLQDSKPPLVLALGRLTPVKGFDLLIRALVGLDARLLIIGDGPERSALERLSVELGLAGQVTFLGPRPDSLVLLQAADLCVVPSLHESTPQVMMDALFAGCPVIATDVGDAGVWLSPALLAPANNVEALHDLLCATLQRLPLLRKNYLPLFLRARQELTVEGMTQRTEAFYEHLLERHQ